MVVVRIYVEETLKQRRSALDDVSRLSNKPKSKDMRFEMVMMVRLSTHIDCTTCRGARGGL